jgi:hypothetical protein
MALIALLVPVICALVFGAWVLHSDPRYIEGCKPYTLFTKPKYPSQVVFIGRIVYLGGRGEITDGPPHSGSWAIMRVEKRFWGVPFLNPGFAVVVNGVFQPKRRYLIAGPGSDVRPLDSLLLTVDHLGCKDSYAIETAEPQLRLLKDGPPRSGVRVIGYVRDERGNAVPSANIIVYDAILPVRPYYTIRPERDNELDRGHRREQETAPPRLTEGSVWGRTVYVRKEGDIEQSAAACSQ